jgi:hypothetical protein
LSKQALYSIDISSVLSKLNGASGGCVSAHVTWVTKISSASLICPMSILKISYTEQNGSIAEESGTQA